MKNYGKKLKETRKRLGYTQAEIANMLDMPQQNWQRYETGTLDLKMSTIYKICTTLNISSDWLLGIGEREEGKLTILSTASAAISNPQKDEGKVKEGVFSSINPAED